MIVTMSVVTFFMLRFLLRVLRKPRTTEEDRTDD